MVHEDEESRMLRSENQHSSRSIQIYVGTYCGYEAETMYEV